MEIHSSSLAFIPKRVEAKKQNETQPSAPSEDSLKNTAPISPKSLTKNEETLKTADFKRFSDDIESLKNSPIKTQSNRALNAYIEENIQPLKNQRAELASRIDFYV